MKKIILTILCCALCLCFCACAAAGATLPLPESTPFEVPVRLVFEGGSRDYTLVVQSETCALLESGDGFTYYYSPDVCTISTGGMTLPIRREFLPDRGLLLTAFARVQDEELLQDTRKDENGGVRRILTRVREEGNFIYELDESGALARIDVEGQTPFVCLLLGEIKRIKETTE